MDLKKQIARVFFVCSLIPLSLAAQDGPGHNAEPVEMPFLLPHTLITGSTVCHGLQPKASGMSLHDPGRRTLLPSLPVLPGSESLPLNGGVQRSGLRITKTWAWVGSAVALAAGAAGYYFKYRADKSYDKYLDTIVPEQMDRHFNDSLKFDKISSACYVSGEVLLVFSLVIFIKTVRTE